MQRLIKDAAALDSSIDANSLSFDNIVKAINVVQTEMGITGTTAKEAASTISGSVGMVKSSWTNLVTGIADDNANLDTLIDNFVESVSVAAGNIAPRVEVALDGVLKLVDGLIPKIATATPNAVAKYAPKLISSGVNILKSLVNGIKGNAKMIVSAAKDIVLNLTDGLVDLLPDVIDAGVELLSGIVEAVPEVAQKLLISMPKIINSITRGLAAGAGGIIKAVRNIFAPVEDIAKIARENLSAALSSLDPFSENVKKASDSVIDVSKSLSDAGNTISDVEQDIENAENKITEILKSALAEQQGLREQDLQNIDKYNDLIRAKEAEKLSIYQDAQIAELRKTILSLANADEQDLAKLLGKSASALEAANQAAESAYTNELIRIENIHKAAGTIGGKQYEEDLKQAKSFYDSLLQQNESVYNQTLSAIFERSQLLIDAGLNEFEKVGEYVDSLNSYIDRWNLTNFLEKDKDFIDAFGIMSKQEADFASGLENLDFKAANAFLSLATTMVNSGAKLDEETQNAVDTILSAFEYIPGAMGDISKEALLELVDGLEEQIPKLENAGEMTAEEIIKAIEDHFKNAEIEVNIVANANVGVDGSHANGLSYVPYDGYIAELHKGERVLTEKEARGFGGNTFNITVNGAKYQNEDTLAEAIAEKIQQITERRAAVYA